MCEVYDDINDIINIINLSSISVKVLSTVGSIVSVSVSVVGQGGIREALEATHSVQTLQD